MPKNETKKQATIRSLLQEKTAAYITAGFGLVASLAWNEAIKELIAFLFPNQQNSLIAKFWYAIIITIVLVAVSAIFLKLQRENIEKGK